MKRDILKEIEQARENCTVAQDCEVIIDKNITVICWWPDDEVQNNYIAVSQGENKFIINCHHDMPKDLYTTVKKVQRSLKWCGYEKTKAKFEKTCMEL